MRSVVGKREEEELGEPTSAGKGREVETDEGEQANAPSSQVSSNHRSTRSLLAPLALTLFTNQRVSTHLLSLPS